MTLVEQLRRDEGVRYRPYTDTVGKLTVGVGRNISDVPFSDDEVNLMLQNDIKARYTALGQYVWFSALDDVRAAAIVNMSFMGVDKLLHFPSMIHYLYLKDWSSAAAEMANSLWAQQVGDRAIRLEAQIRTGEW